MMLIFQLGLWVSIPMDLMGKSSRIGWYGIGLWTSGAIVSLLLLLPYRTFVVMLLWAIRPLWNGISRCETLSKCTNMDNSSPEIMRGVTGRPKNIAKRIKGIEKWNMHYGAREILIQTVDWSLTSSWPNTCRSENIREGSFGDWWPWVQTGAEIIAEKEE